MLISRVRFTKSNYSEIVVCWSVSLLRFLWWSYCGLGMWCLSACEPPNLDSPQRGRRLPISNWTSGINHGVHSLDQFNLISYQTRIYIHILVLCFICLSMYREAFICNKLYFYSEFGVVAKLCEIYLDLANWIVRRTCVLGIRAR